MKRLLLFILLFATTQLDAVELYVAPTGNDNNNGTATAPFATIQRARDAVRSLKAAGGLPAEGVQVWLRGGHYNQSASLLFDGRDSGSATAPVTYASAPGEQAYVTGAAALDAGWFALVNEQSPIWGRLDPAARGQVHVANLRERGITNYGTFKPRGFNIRAIAPLELFAGGQPMTLGRWPNASDELARTAGANSATQVAYYGSRQDRWTEARDGWLHGFWQYAWADFHVPVANVDAASNVLNLANGPAQFGVIANRPYYAYNFIEEIDQPGEYYVDRTAGLLYYWPLTPLGSASLQVSMLEETLVELRDVEHMVWRDVIFEASRAALLKIEGGSNNRIERCVLRNAGQFGTSISGTGNGLDRCELADCGEEGLLLTGGNRATLTPGGNYVKNSRIRRTGRVGWTYRPGVNLSEGVGNRVSNNLLDDMPHGAILFSGNDHVMENNEIRNVGRVASDVGAIYSGRDWGFRGNVIRGNFLHDISSTQGGDGVHAVYLDDCVSGVEVSGNVFYRINGGAAVFCGGGRDNIIRNNIIAHTGLAHYNDDRGRTRIDNVAGSPWNLLELLGADGIRYQQEPWASAYPALAAIPNSWSTVQTGVWRNPQNSVFSRNVGWGNNIWTFENDSDRLGVFRLYASFADNESAHPSLLDDATAADRSTRPVQLTANVAGFQPIAFRAIGPSLDNVPAPSAAPFAPTLTGRASWDREITLTWADNSNLPTMQEAGFAVEQRNPDGSWRVLRSFNTDADSMVVGGLAASTYYTFRVRAFNSVGSAYSNLLTLATRSPPAVVGAATRIEAETPLTVVRDVGGNASVGTTDAELDSGQSVRLFDAGDAIRIPFTVPSTGNYRLAARMRAGGANAATAFWPGGYQFQVDGTPLEFVGDASTLSAFDSQYGGSYWGRMTADVALSAGGHALEIASNASWTAADYLEFASLTGGAPAPPPPPPPAPPPSSSGAPVRFEAEDPLVVASDLGTNGAVGVSDAALDSGRSVRLYDVGDAIRVTVNVAQSGSYRIDARVRSGGSTGATVFWPDGYRFRIDGTSLAMQGDAATVSARDEGYGGSFWGTQRSGTLTLSTGAHTVEIAAGLNWAVADYVELVPVAGGAASGSPPTITVPPDIVVEASAADGATVAFTTTARDSAGNAVPTVNSPASGTKFPLAATTVTVTATDSATRTASRTFLVTVRDTTAPIVTVPSDMGVQATGASGAAVGFVTLALDSVSGARSTTNSPASGSVFPVGTTTVTARATDSAGNVGTATFRVTVAAQGVAPPAAPVGLAATSGDGQIELGWSPTSSAASYTVKRGASSGGPYFVVAANVSQTGYTDTALTNNTTYYYVVSATNAGGESANSAPVSGVPAAGSADASWTSSDVGSVRLAGKTTLGPASFSVSGAGADIWGNVDAFRYVYKALTGDGVITARVASVQFTDGWAKAGVMIRETLQANSRFAGVYATPANGMAFQWRAGTGAQCSNRQAAGAAPRWVRLTRAGNVFTAHTSSDGSTWVSLGTADIAMGASVYIGLAVTSHRDDALCAATFENVVATGGAGTVPPTAPSAPAAPTTLAATTLSATQVSARWTDNATNETGFQLERSTDNVTFALVATTGPNVVSYIDATVTGMNTYHYRVRAINGSTVSTFATVASVTTPAGTAPVAVWQQVDVGAVGRAGSNESAGNTITLRGSGVDIWDNADGFRFLYQVLRGDGQIEARVMSVQNTNAWAKAGVMIRESLTANSRNAFACVTAANGVAFQVRATTGGGTSGQSGAWGLAAPYWVRLIRMGATITGATSSDGITWTSFPAASVPMAGDVYIGFAVTAHDNTALTTATFADPFIR